MAGSIPGQSYRLNLRAGELVEVRSESEILSTLDENGTLEDLPFMPEMLQFCGKRFRVYRRADKTCDTIHNTGIRRMKDCVHLEELRCGGEAHGGCQARCLIFWKEAWLKREGARSARQERSVHLTGHCTSEDLIARTHKPKDATGEEPYSCQATELFRATSPLSPRELGPYIRDLRSGNVSIGEWLRGLSFALFRKLTRIGGDRIWGRAYDLVDRKS